MHSYYHYQSGLSGLETNAIQDLHKLYRQFLNWKKNKKQKNKKKTYNYLYLESEDHTKGI